MPELLLLEPLFQHLSLPALLFLEVSLNVARPLEETRLRSHDGADRDAYFLGRSRRRPPRSPVGSGSMISRRHEMSNEKNGSFMATIG
jgi:hypothetical protein